MSSLKEAKSAKQLYDRGERAIARMARMARMDTINGGARALVIAKRLEAMGSRQDYGEVVSWVYRHSNYSCGPYGVYECPECGSAHLGTEAAYACCAMAEDCED